MRDYRDVSASVLRRRDEQLAKDRHRMYIWKRSGAIALSFCFVGAIALGIHKHGTEKPQREHDTNENIIVPTETSVTETAHTDVPSVTSEDSQSLTTNKTTVQSQVTTVKTTAVPVSSEKAGTAKTTAAVSGFIASPPQ